MGQSASVPASRIASQQVRSRQVNSQQSSSQQEQSGLTFFPALNETQGGSPATSSLSGSSNKTARPGPPRVNTAPARRARSPLRAFQAPAHGYTQSFPPVETTPIPPVNASYDLPPNAGRESDLHSLVLAVDTFGGRRARSCVANSGVNTWEDYPVSTSPRMNPRDVENTLAEHQWYEERRDTPARFYRRTGFTLDQDIRNEQSSIDTEAGFQHFSFSAASQPRTERARQIDGEPVSPRTRPTIEQMSQAKYEIRDRAARLQVVREVWEQHQARLG